MVSEGRIVVGKRRVRRRFTYSMVGNDRICNFCTQIQIQCIRVCGEGVLRGQADMRRYHVAVNNAIRKVVSHAVSPSIQYRLVW